MRGNRRSGLQERLRNRFLTADEPEQTNAEDQLAHRDHNQPPEPIEEAPDAARVAREQHDADLLSPFIRNVLNSLGLPGDGIPSGLGRIRPGEPDPVDRLISQRRRAQLVFTEPQLKEWYEARRHLPAEIERRIKVRQGLISDDQLHAWFREQKVIEAAEIARQSRLASTIFRDPDAPKKSAIREHEFRQRQVELPGVEDWKHGAPPQLLLPISMLIAQFRELSDVEDDARLTKAKVVTEMERRFDAGEMGDQYLDFRDWCAEHLPESSWPDLQRLLRQGKSANPAAARAREKQKNREYNKRRRERKKQEVAALRALAAAQQQQPFEQHPESHVRFDGATETDGSEALGRDASDDLLEAATRVIDRMKFEKGRIKTEWPASARRRLAEGALEALGYESWQVPVREAVE